MQKWVTKRIGRNVLKTTTLHFYVGGNDMKVIRNRT